MRRKTEHSGFLLTELIVAMTVLVIILSCMAMMLKVFRDVNQYQLARQQCIAAAQAQLDCITVTHRPIKEEDVNRLWPKVSMVTEETDGKEQWQGLKLVKVRATAAVGSKEVIVELARYIKPQEAGLQ